MHNLFRAAIASALVCACAALTSSAGDSDTAAPTVQILSSSASEVTGGSSLVAASPSAATAHVSINGIDMSSAFVPDPNDSTRLLGVVSGLATGDNTLAADVGGDRATLTLTNYPLAGPVFSGPHQTPFVCQTDLATLPSGQLRFDRALLLATAAAGVIARWRTPAGSPPARRTPCSPQAPARRYSTT